MKIIFYGAPVVLMVLLMAALNASGEYYQYTDPNGSVRFTDDISLIPPEQREDARIYESFVTYSEDPEPLRASTENEGISSPANNVDMETVDEIPSLPASGNKNGIEAAKLKAMREQLKKAHKELEGAKNTLGAPSRELEQKIEAYNKISIEFNEKVKTFNSSNT
jgi:hypothetical protein